MTILLIYLALGAAVGVYAGMLGVGGGVILVPILDFTLAVENVAPEILHHMALATSLASIMFTSLSSARGHHRRGAVRWDVVRAMTPTIILGTWAGTFIVSLVPSGGLKIIFGVFLLYTAMQMLFDVKVSEGKGIARTRLVFRVAGAVVGFVSSFIGIGGGALSIPFLVFCGFPMMQVIGTSAALGLPIAVGGTVGFAVAGWNHPELPPFSLGFIYLPALVGLAAASMLTAPYGVRLAHYLPVKLLKRILGLVLAFVGGRMLYNVLFG